MLLGSPPDMIHGAPSYRTHAPYGQIKAHFALICENEALTRY